MFEFFLQLLSNLSDALERNDHLVRNAGLEQLQDPVRVLHLLKGVKVGNVGEGRDSVLLLV